MSTLRIAEGALPIATRLTLSPWVALVKRDQSPPGSPTPISAKLIASAAAPAGHHRLPIANAAAATGAEASSWRRRIVIPRIFPSPCRGGIGRHPEKSDLGAGRAQAAEPVGRYELYRRAFGF